MYSILSQTCEKKIYRGRRRVTNNVRRGGQMAPPRAIIELVERFHEQFDNYVSPKYNETQVRREFIDPLFKALGWDVDNTQGFSEAYKEVVHEEAIKIAGDHRAPDYSFRIGGGRKFFLEAKKPAVSINDEFAPAYQLRRYAWSAKLPLSVITSFREFAVYDCRVRPAKIDRPSVARIMYLTFDEYGARWDEIAGVFSKEAIYKGGFDRFVDSNKLIRGTAEFDDDFLAEIESWRDVLARNMALRNPRLAQEELNYAVQSTIDRIIFLRIGEDRGLEPYKQLQSISVGDQVYGALVKLFKSADERYNSGLFHFRPETGRAETPDTITPRLIVDDRPLKGIISALYYPESPYEFSVVGADILGQVYEQFLGKIIRLTLGHRAVIEEKPEVKKAGGVYYTPTYIVNYIVRQTLGIWLKGKSVAQTKKLRILDPACGSGSFLIAAYQYLLDWHLERYSRQPENHRSLIYRGGHGEWRLTSAERKRILTTHIFGVDVDQQAVEVTKLSLMLKVLEGESSDSLKKQLEMFHERALPDLGTNIKCGNSLIGPEFYANEQFDMLDDTKRGKVNLFDWEGDGGFKETMSRGGFDVIVGNPPYVNAWIMYETHPEIRNYINSAKLYRSADRHWDAYILFLEKSLMLLRSSGYLSFIIPFSYCIQKYATLSRKIITEECTISSIADLRTVRVFKNVPVITIIPVVIRSKPSPHHRIQILGPGHGATDRHPGDIALRHKVAQGVFRDGIECMWRLDLRPTAVSACDAIEAASITVGDISWVNYGAQMSSKKKKEFGKEYVLRDRRASKTCKKTISGRDLYRYNITWNGQYVEWALAPKMYGPRESWFFETPKLMIRDITGTHRLELSLDESKLYCDHTVLCCLRICDAAGHHRFDERAVRLSAEYPLELLLGLLASRPISAFYYWKLTGEGVRTGGGFHTYPNTIRALPVFDVTRASRFSGTSRKEHHNAGTTDS